MKSVALESLATPAVAATAATTPHAGWLSGLIGAVRQRAAERSLRRQLAGMDTSLLRDIGVEEDEIWRIRNGERFTPRAWA